MDSRQIIFEKYNILGCELELKVTKYKHGNVSGIVAILPLTNYSLSTVWSNNYQQVIKQEFEKHISCEIRKLNLENIQDYLNYYKKPIQFKENKYYSMEMPNGDIMLGVVNIGII